MCQGDVSLRLVHIFCDLKQTIRYVLCEKIFIFVVFGKLQIPPLSSVASGTRRRGQSGQLGVVCWVSWVTSGWWVGSLGAHWLAHWGLTGWLTGAHVDNQEQTHNDQHPYICHAVSGDREYFRHIVLKKTYICCITTFLAVSVESTLEQ